MGSFQMKLDVLDVATKGLLLICHRSNLKQKTKALLTERGPVFDVRYECHGGLRAQLYLSFLCGYSGWGCNS